MTGTSGFHPDIDMLRDFATGNLSTGISIAVSAHLELCTACRERASELESQAILDWMQKDSVEPAGRGDSTPDFSDMVAEIVAQPQARQAPVRDSAVNEIHFLDHSATLPRILAKAACDGLVWRKLAGGINQASVRLDSETQCEFLYMKPGSQTPVHTHQGTEITLVLDGGFSDELGHYEVSDFVVRQGKHVHQPRSDEGCLCFAVLDSPLRFTQGLARLLNPIGRYQFRRALSQSR